MLAQLASGIAHEIRNPLNFINLSIDHLATLKSLQAVQGQTGPEDLIRKMKAEVQRINQMVTNFLDLGRELVLHPILLRVDLPVEEALGLNSQSIQDRGIFVERDYPDPSADGRNRHRQDEIVFSEPDHQRGGFHADRRDAEYPRSRPATDWVRPWSSRTPARASSRINSPTCSSLISPRKTRVPGSAWPLPDGSSKPTRAKSTSPAPRAMGPASRFRFPTPARRPSWNDGKS